ncbi:MAG: hypothetical protein Q7J06_01175 [Bacteroidales bacterium]|nr:hypothetical protein [Bacteroidales bacterium]
MGYKRESHNVQPLLLSSEDKGNGFSIVADNRHNITLSKWSKPVAWFSAALSEETLKAFVVLVKGYEGNVGAIQV